MSSNFGTGTRIFSEDKICEFFVDKKSAGFYRHSQLDGNTTFEYVPIV